VRREILVVALSLALVAALGLGAASGQRAGPVSHAAAKRAKKPCKHRAGHKKNKKVCRKRRSDATAHDVDPPAAPVLSSTAPASPGSSVSPRLIGSAEQSTTIAVYTDPACSRLAGSGTATELASPGIQAAVPADAMTSLFAIATDPAGNRSSCSAPLAYTEDSIAPGTPTLSSSDPASPANDATPRVFGSADQGTVVRLYTDATCSTLAATGGSGQLASPGLQVPAAADSTTTLYATATDAAGNTSRCSSTPLTYVEDSTAPPPPSLTATSPDSPGSGTTPRVTGSAEVGSAVKIYADAACAVLVGSGEAIALSSPGLTATVPPSTPP
jgi:hypothetical protein